MQRRTDAVAATIAGAIAFAVYVRTLAPGLIMIVDTPMFQFIGRVLGIAHNPGYPLYVLLSHPFSYLPIGSLAYRINLFSALLGAVAVAMTYLIARRIGAGAIVSFAAALGLAFGRVFWSQSIIAEVYTLNAALVGAMIAALLTWGDTGRPAWFFAAAALFSIGLGNHTTIAGFGPGMLVYAVMKDRRFALRPSTIAACTLMLAAGLAQYGFLLIRSKPGVYAESPARNLTDVLNIVSGRQFSSWLFAYDLPTVLWIRIPLLTRAIVVPELTMPGIALALVGAVYLLRHRLADALLLLSGGAVIFGFCINYSATDIHVFLIPLFLVSWPLVAVGADRLARLPARQPALGTAAATALLLVPAWQLHANMAANDLSHRSEAKVYFDKLFEGVPDRTLFVREDFIVDRSVSYKLVGEEAARGRTVGLIGANVGRLLLVLKDGYHVLAFPTAASRLRFDGVDVSYAPWPVIGPRIDEILADAEPGTIVAIGAPAMHTGGFVAAGGRALERVGVPSRPLAAAAQSNLAVLGAVGTRHTPIARIDPRAVTFDVSQGAEIGATGVRSPGAIRVRADATEAAISLGGRDIVRTGDGVAVAVWSAAGTLERAFVLRARDGFRERLTPAALTLHGLRGLWTSAPVGSEPTDITRLAASGWTMIAVPPAGRVRLDVHGATPLAPGVIDRSSKEVAARVERSASGTYAIELASSDHRAALPIEITFGGVPDTVTARTLGPAAAPATAYAMRNDGVMQTPDDATELVRMNRDEQAHLFGAGWSGVDHDDAGNFRWVTEREAWLLLPATVDAPTRVRVQALRERAGPQTPTAIALKVNGRDLPSQPLEDGWHTYEWRLEAGTMRAGANVAAIVLDRLPPDAGSPRRGFAVAEIAVIHQVTPAFGG